MVLPSDGGDSSKDVVDDCVPHPLLSKNGETSEESALLERVMVIDTDLRKPQEVDQLTTHMYPHKISGLSIVSGVGLVDSSRSDVKQEPEAVPPTTAEWSHLLSTASYLSPPSAILLILMLDPYPPKLLRQPLHSLFLSLLIDARFKSRFAAALGVAYRSLTTLFCAGVGTESDTPLGFTVQIFTAGSLVRALGSTAAISRLLCSDGEAHSAVVNKHILSIPISHNIVRCIHSNLLGSTKEVKEATKAAGSGETVGASDSGEVVNPALVYQSGEHCMTTLLPAAPDDEFLDSRSTRHKRLPHLLRDLEYIFETPGTSVRLLLAVAAATALPNAPFQPMPPVASVDPSLCLTFPTIWARLLRIGQGMDPQKRRISGGHVEFEQNRWLEAFGLSLNLAGAYDALAESPAISGLGGAPSDLVILRASVGNIFSSLLKEMKSWLYREGRLETGVPVPPTSGALGDLARLEALQRSTLHLSTSQIRPSETLAEAPTISAIALSCATSVKMTEAQLNLIEEALEQEANLATSSGPSNSVRGAAMGDWLRCPHSPLAGDSLSFHLPLHRALARSLRSFCSVTVPTSEREVNPKSWWKVPVLDDETPHDAASAAQHPLAALIRPTIRSSNCRVVWAAGPDCTSQEAQQRRSRSRMVASSIAAAKIIHSICDHPLRCLVASQQIERHLWARNGSAAAGQALNYGSSPLCRSFRDLDLAMVQFSAAGLSVGLGARRVYALLLSRFSLEGYLCDPERRGGGGLSPTGSVASGGGSPNSYGPSSAGWVNPPRMQDPDHAVALAECFFTTLCVLVTELPSPPPTSSTDTSALRCNMKRELLHALAAEPRSHSEAMAAVAGAVTRRDETDSGAGSGDADSATSFRVLFADVLKEIGKQKSQGSRSSGTPMFELKANASDEYDPTFFHLRRHEHQHAMDTVARLRRQKISPPGSPKAEGKTRCLPLVVQPPASHPRFLPGRLILHLPALDASIRRALLFALTGGRWLPPDEPSQFLSDDEADDLDGDDMVGSSKLRGLGSSSGLGDSANPSPAGTPRSSPRRSREARRRAYQRNTSSSFVKPRRGNSSLSDIGDDFSPETVAGSSVSFLEVLQILTLQVHTLDECASLHRTHALDEESRSLSAGLSINSYLSRLVFTPPSLVDVWALRCAPYGPLPSKGSGLNRGSVLGLLIALYEHRADHGGSEKTGDSGHADEGHGGARALSADGLKWLLRFVNSLVDGANTLSAACEAASSGRRYRSAREDGNNSSHLGDSISTESSIDPEVSKLVSGMLANLPDLWPVEIDSTSSGPGDADRMSAKSREARKAAQRRAMERMMKAQSSFAASLSVENGGTELDAETEDDEEADLCIICRCDDADGENNGPLGFLGHVQRSRALQLRSLAEGSQLSPSEEDADGLYQAYRVVGDRGCQLRATESMSSRPLSCIPVGSVVTVLESKVSSKYDILSRRVRVRYTNPKTNETIVGWGSIQSSQGYVILSPLSTLCYNNSRWGSTRPLIRQCGHAAHLLCVEAHCLSLHQRAAGDQPYDGRFAANIDDGEFLCPLCKQLSNILIPDVGRKASVFLSSRTSSSLVSSPQTSSTQVANKISSIRDILCSPCTINYDNAEEKGDKMATAIKQFGTRLYLGVQIPWDRMSTSRKREQRAWHPALRRWDFEEEADSNLLPSLAASGSEDDPAIGGLLRLLRQQHIAWASVGHSVAASEASARGVMGMEDPWSDYSQSARDTIPAILDLRRTIGATSALFELMSYELGRELGDESSKSSGMNVTLVGGLLADILEGRFWSVGLPSPSDDENVRGTFKQWQVLTSLVAATPCHVARDGMLPQRHEARATAAALWAVKGMGVQSAIKKEESNASTSTSPAAVTASAGTTDDNQVGGAAAAPDGDSNSTGIEIPSPRKRGSRKTIPTPMVVQRTCSAGGVDRPLDNAWGTMDPFLASHSSAQAQAQAQEDGVEVHLGNSPQDVKPPTPFRPAVASAFLYVPLLAWDLNTLAGAIFSSMFVNKGDSMTIGDDDLLVCSRTLLIGRLIQVLVTPGGFDEPVELDPNDWEAQEARDEFQEQWEAGEMLEEAKSLANLLMHCRDAAGASSSGALHFDVRIDSEEVAAQFLHSVGLAILPFARSLVLLLRGCSSLLRQQGKRDQRDENPFKLDKQSTSNKADDMLQNLLESPETMTYGDGFRILKIMGAPLPSQILKGASSSSDITGSSSPSSWFALINRWLSSIHGFEAYHGSKGRGLVFDEQSGAWTPASASKMEASTSTQEEDGTKKKFIVQEQGVQTASSSEGTSTMGVEIEVAPSADDEDNDVDIHGLSYNASIDMDDASAGFDEGMENAEEEDIELEEDDMEMLDMDDEDDSDDEAEMEDVEMIGESSGSQASLYGMEDSGVDVSDDEDSSESGSASVDKEFANVTRSAIIPFQSSLLGSGGIGPGPRGNSFEFFRANSMMSDLSHLGMVHRIGSTASGLIRMPHSFVELYSLVNKVKGRTDIAIGAMDDADDGGSSETAICLITGSVMAAGSSRRTYARGARPPGACTLHAQQVGSGVGIFFLIQKCTVLLIHNNKSAYSASLYVDEHGEEDPGLRRGRPLFLKDERYESLEKLWREHSVPREVAQTRSTSDRVIRDNWY